MLFKIYQVNLGIIFLRRLGILLTRSSSCLTAQGLLLLQSLGHPKRKAVYVLSVPFDSRRVLSLTMHLRRPGIEPGTLGLRGLCSAN